VPRQERREYTALMSRHSGHSMIASIHKKCEIARSGSNEKGARKQAIGAAID
jgi:hypothetical protein